MIEHLVDPWTTVTRLGERLKPGAIVIASSPNISHWRVILGLLCGRFDYADRGVMDGTHLRWFTPSSFCALFERAGIEIEIIRPICAAGWRARFITRMSRGTLAHLFMSQMLVIGHRKEARSMTAKRDFAIAAAVNDRAILAKCLAASPDIVAGKVELATFEGYRTAGSAYNAALDHCGARYLILPHQDVYLPAGFIDRLADTLRALEAADPDWAIAGVVGCAEDGTLVGHTWCSGNDRVIGSPDNLPQRVESLDELLLIIRCDAHLHFDPRLPSFHLYGTDIVQTARRARRTAYAIDAPVIHHSRPVAQYGGGYRQAYRYMQRKWRSELPIPNPVARIERSIIPLLIRDLKKRLRRLGRGRGDVPQSDPAEIARTLGFE